MKDVIWTIKIALACVLVLNLCITRSAQADPPPPPPPPPCETGDCFTIVQQGVFMHLFGQQWATIDPWGYAITDGAGQYLAMEGPGDYTGYIYSGQTFAFHCTYYSEVPLDCVQQFRGEGQGEGEGDIECSDIPPEYWLPPDVAAALEAEQVRIGMIAGILSTDLGQLPIVGYAQNGVPTATGVFTSFFVVLNLIDPNHPLIVGDGPAPGALARPGPWDVGPATGLPGNWGESPSAGGGDPVVPPSVIVDPQEHELQYIDPCQQCQDQFARDMYLATRAREIRIDAANRVCDAAERQAVTEFANAKAAAQGTRDAAVAAAEHACDVAMAEAAGTFVIEMSVCFLATIWVPLLTGLLGAGCVALASAKLILAAKIATDTFLYALQTADQTQALAVAAAEAAYGAALDAAYAAHDNEVQAAYDEWALRAQQAQLDLESCMQAHGCCLGWDNVIRRE